MAKHKREVRVGKTHDVQRMEHTEVFDDNLLPDALEIQKLHAIDSTILTWLKDRAEQEQSFRHKAYDKRIDLIDVHNAREHNTNRFALIIYFLLVAGCLCASFYLISMGKNLQGTIFGGAGAVLAIAVLVARKEPEKPESK